MRLSTYSVGVMLLVMGPMSHLAAGKRVNVLLITSEDNGPELGCYGDPYARTPNLDRLASEGVRFNRAFVATASCSESRSALLTGLYPHQNGQIGLASELYRQFEGVPNVIRHLHSAGYRTGLIGKLHISPEEAFPFDFRPDVRQYNTFYKRNVREVARQADRFFRSGEEPFFLMVNFADAHLPFLRREHGLPAKPLSADDVQPLPWIGLDTNQLRQSQADYYNCIERMDAGVGLLLAKLQGADLAERTIVIYLGDHGAQFPRGKLASYESSLRVPLIVRWPQHLPAGQVRQQLVSSIDVVPTIYEAVGAESPIQLPGLSLMGLKSDEDVPWRKYLHSEYHGHYPPLYFPQRTIRDERYKLIVNLLQDRKNPVAEFCSWMDRPPHPPYVSPQEVAAAPERVKKAYAVWRESPPVELYDLQVDPHEWQNRGDDPDLADVRKRLLSELRRWQKTTSDPLADPAELKRLTEEHDAIAKPYARDPGFRFEYPKYLMP